MPIIRSKSATVFGFANGNLLRLQAIAEWIVRSCVAFGPETWVGANRGLHRPGIVGVWGRHARGQRGADWGCIDR
jgi:hypothetical protein